MKKKLLLLHGALGSSGMMEPLALSLSDDFTVYSYDFPGHGGKPFPEESLNINVLCRHLQEYIHEFHLTGAAVFGYSMGGYAALKLESTQHGTFSSIMTLATKFDWTPDIALKEISLLDADKMEAKIPAYVKALQERHGTDNWRKVLSETMHLMKHLGTHHLTSDDFGNINCAVRIALGDRDQMVSIDETIRAYKELSNASLLIMPATSHPFEKLDFSYLSSEIKRFIK